VASAVSKAFRVMWLLRRSPEPLNLSEIARSVSIAQSTAHSVLKELLSQGALVQDDNRRYSVGPAMFYLGAAYVKQVPVHSRIWDSLVVLADDVRLTAVLAVPWRDYHLILDVHQNPQPGVDVAFGGRVPIDAGAWGKAYYAWSDEKPPTLSQYTPKTIVELDEYERQREEARARGYATDLGEFLVGAGAVASAVTNGKPGVEAIVALVGGAGSTPEASLSDAGQRLAGLAANVSYALGDGRRVKVIGQD
jgi:IclR family transcriptional regulator, acetate operon repressor